MKLTAMHCLDEKIKPIAINWPDGRNFEIDKMIDARIAASLKGGGNKIHKPDSQQGIFLFRTIKINGL